MKKIIALVAIVAMFAAFSISVVGKKLPSIGYVLVGPIVLIGKVGVHIGNKG